MITILDYGMGNLRSVQKAFEHVGVPARLSAHPDEIDQSEKVVLPGVGAMADAVTRLRESGMDQAVRRHVLERGKPLLGVCLGLQVLFDVGYEDGEHQGLGLLPGKVVRFEVDRTQGLKVPHMGWNTLDLRQPCPLFEGLVDGAGVYFVHSYHVVPERPDDTAALTNYGGPFTSAVWRDNLMAVQFHPEKSQAAGLRMLENFAKL